MRTNIYRYYRNVLVLLFLIWSFKGIAQGSVGLTIANATALCNNAISVPVKVSNFNSLLSLQGSLKWDISKLSFRGIDSYGPATLGMNSANFGLNATSTGILTFMWNSANLLPQTLADSTVLFSIQLLATGSDNSVATVSLLSSPTILEAVNSDMQTINVNAIAGNIFISCSQVGSSADTLSLTIPSLNTQCSPEIIIPIKASGFRNLLSCQGTIGWDINKLSFQRIESYGPAELALTASNFGLNSTSIGKLPFMWSAADAVAKTLPDTTDLFKLRFVVRGNTGTNTIVQFLESPTQTEAANGNLQVVQTKTNAGQININCSTTGNFTFIAPTITSNTCSGTIDIPIRVKSFSGILSMQGSFQWDPSKLQYQSVISYGPAALALGAGNFGLASVASGNLSFSWNDADLSGETLTDSSTIFTVRFNIIGAGGTNSYLQFANNPTMLEVVNAGFNTMTVQTANGACNIICGSNIYTFTGNGNWNVTTNWSNNTIPPAVLPSGSQIIIDPVTGGECVLNVSQRISTGAIFSINTGKKLRVVGGVVVQ